jgi:hypothetical protein
VFFFERRTKKTFISMRGAHGNAGAWRIADKSLFGSFCSEKDVHPQLPFGNF